MGKDIEFQNCKVMLGDCLERMKEIPDGSFDLTVTSPPYDNLRTYNGYSFDFENIAKELYRVTKDGGIVVWVVNDATIKGSETGSSFKQALYFKDECGFNLHDTMIWRKPNAPPQTKVGMRYTNQHEYMFVLSKGKPNSFNPIQQPCLTAGNPKTGAGTQRTFDGLKKHSDVRNKTRKNSVVKETKPLGSVWDCSILTKNIGHPAAFPEQLVQDHIISWSNEGDTVFDPFAGSGTTAKMALLNNRKFIGCEISDEYMGIIYERLYCFHGVS